MTGRLTPSGEASSHVIVNLFLTGTAVGATYGGADHMLVELVYEELEVVEFAPQTVGEAAQEPLTAAA